MVKKISLRDARSAGLKHYFTGLACVHGHVAQRRVSTRICVVCANDHRNAHRARDLTYNDRRRARYAADPEYKRKKRDGWAKWAANNAESFMLSVVKGRSKRLGIRFNLALDDIKIPKRCPILNIRLTRGVGSSCNNSPTLDRVVPSKGYTRGNVAVISDLANRMKGFATAAQHRRIADWMDCHG